MSHALRPPREVDLRVGALGWEVSNGRGLPGGCFNWRAAEKSPAAPALPPPLSSVWLVRKLLCSLWPLAVKNGLSASCLGAHPRQRVPVSRSMALLRALSARLLEFALCNAGFLAQIFEGKIRMRIIHG